jgi:hypothetical protein
MCSMISKILLIIYKNVVFLIILDERGAIMCDVVGDDGVLVVSSDSVKRYLRRDDGTSHNITSPSQKSCLTQNYLN